MAAATGHPPTARIRAQDQHPDDNARRVQALVIGGAHDAGTPISSDVDCAGGGGNGPAYFDGIATVVGSDIYELDRDGDGYACEPN